MFGNFFKDLTNKQRLIFDLSKKDFKSKYLGSYLGIVWGFVQPLIQILIFWFVFQVGFKSTPIDNFPFILWLSTAMIPWFFLSESIQSGTNAILDNSYLVKKVVFQISILPIVKIYSALFVHIFFIVFLNFMFLVYGFSPNIYILQVLYYLICIFFLTLGITLITSSLVIFLKDIGQIIAMLLQFGFWLTPIFYSISTVPERYHKFIKLNPVYYIVEGYRDTFIYHKWFWEHPNLTINFWVITICLLLMGIFIFKKLRPHFADVL
ncbi:ABC transporter permease [Paenibacillus alginolyticus]|uniref:ABC transporter permease n=1 Tax=Paenibacillus alginolyticus TaxID=59839 RepID=UPI0003FD6E28|nr:ABC transporter permease [Paenibacillus alginolyticus]MCY9664843.1 ABC transporter permease [Paenibacillus alginolyticus]